MTALGDFSSGDVLTAADLNAIGTWTTYTPTLYGITLGNGTLTFEYTTLNEMVFVKGRLNLGSTTNVTGNVSIGLPVTAASSRYSTAACVYNDFGTRLHVATGLMNATDRFLLLHAGILNSGIVNGTNPFTWATNDDIYTSLFYEAA